MQTQISKNPNFLHQKVRMFASEEPSLKMSKSEEPHPPPSLTVDIVYGQALKQNTLSQISTIFVLVITNCFVNIKQNLIIRFCLHLLFRKV